MFKVQGERELFPGPCCVSMRVFGVCGNFLAAVQKCPTHLEQLIVTRGRRRSWWVTSVCQRVVIIILVTVVWYTDQSVYASMRCALSAGLFVKESSFNGGGGGVSTTA
ncbi:hypothetical protein T02_2611 [Trichinella nativa]|uniref:Uncharacterized protein n=1 Tax=Trichinella nativa TaxID=6335 RepID=A0A0V1KYI1_9BILA|nr:hypothetical protein T02_2611 [Trichinella nativa]